MLNSFLKCSFLLTIMKIVSVSAGDSSNLDDPVLFCDGCFALVSEVEKDMSVNTGQKLNTRIEKTLSGVCSTDRLRAYKFSPPTQVKTCSAILARYKLVLSNILREEYRGGRTSTVETLTSKFCTQVTFACDDDKNISYTLYRLQELVWVGRFLHCSRKGRGKRLRQRQKKRRNKMLMKLKMMLKRMNYSLYNKINIQILSCFSVFDSFCSFSS